MATFGSVDVAVKFIADATSVKNEASKVEGMSGKLKAGLIGLGTAVGGAFAVGQVKEFVGAAEESEVATNRLAKTLANAGDTTGAWAAHAGDLATSLMNQTGIDDEVIKGGQAILSTFHSVGATAGETGGAFDRASAAALDMSKAGFGSVESASTMLGKALEDPVKGITALGKAGVTFSEDQKAAIKAMVESGDKAGAMNLILQNVEGQVGGVAAATATASDKMKVAWGEAQEKIGAALLPAIQALMPAFQKLLDAIAPIVDALAPIIPIVGEVAGVFGNILGNVIKAIAPIITELLKAFEPLLPVIQEAAQQFAVALGGALIELSPILIELVKAVVPLLPSLLKLATILLEALLPAMEPLIPIITKMIEIIGIGLVKAIDILIVPLETMARWLGENTTLVQSILIALGLMGAVILATLVPAFLAWAAGALAAAAATLLAILPFVLIGAAIAALAYVVITNWDTIKAVTIAVWDAIKGAIQAAVDWIVGAFQWLWDKASAVFGWIRDNWPLLLAILTGPFGIAVKLIIDNWDSIKGGISAAIDWLRNIMSTVGEIVTAPFRWAKDQIDRIVDGIKGAFQGAVDGVKNIWNAFARFWNGIEVEVPGVTMPGPIPDIPGFTFGLPDLPTFAKGGILTKPTLGVFGDVPEAVIPLSQLDQRLGPRGPVVHIEHVTLAQQVDVDLFMRRVAWAAQTERI